MYNEAVEAVRHWATQTIIYSMSANTKSGPLEVFEEINLRAHALANRLTEESVADCGGNTSPSRVIPILFAKVFCYVAERHQSR